MTVQRDRTAAGDLIQIDKVLQLEERKGFRDTAASNGLVRFVGERTARLLATAQGDARRQLQEIDALLGNYDRLSDADRQRSVSESRSILANLVRQPWGPMSAAPEPRANARRVQTPQNSPIPAQAPEPPAAPHKATASPEPRRKQRASPRIGSLADSVRLLPGVGAGRATQLQQLGVETVGDLLRLYPRRYIDYGDVQPIASLLFGRMTTIHGVVESADVVRTRTGKEMVDVVVSDGTGRIHATWFNPWIARQLTPGTPVSLSGRVEQMRGNLCLMNPEWETLGAETLSTGRLTPVYPLTKNLYQKTLRPLMRAALDAGLNLVEDPLPEEVRARENVIGFAEALEWVHFPDGETSKITQDNLYAAQRRLAFDEFLTLQLGLLRRKQEWQGQPGNAVVIDEQALGAFYGLLPFELTGAQVRAVGEILADMARPEPMTRLLQGDVGSGKTIVAAIAAFSAIRAGYQVALMAPTEILAEQHGRGLEQVFAALPEELRPRLGFLTGSVSGLARETVYAGAADGSVDLLIGTQALIQGAVEYHRLGLAIVDEQHRFGVEQRGLLRGKGDAPDVLVMTATPIPRTLALTLHGDLDVSTLDELPPGRQPITTHWIQERQRAEAYRFVRQEVEQGRQAFVVFPLVEESEVIEARAAVAEHARLSREVFPDLRVGLLHGRMKPSEKDATMIAFRDHEIDILVSTSVIEVGIDVPNATVMLIDGADRFGLSQLHQFRGRVGRGAEKSTCILVSGDASMDGRTRLQAMVDTQDGFKLAQIDLDIRGPGDFLGTRQSGFPELQMASFADVRDLERARAAAERILAADPELRLARHALLRARVDAFWARTVADVS
jgi:ATP-dependent DNA helicase RecG